MESKELHENHLIHEQVYIREQSKLFYPCESRGTVLLICGNSHGGIAPSLIIIEF